MVVSARQTAIFLQFLHHLKAHTLQFSVRCQHKHHFFHKTSSWVAITIWSFQRSCRHGRTTVPVCWEAFCGCLPIKPKIVVEQYSKIEILFPLFLLTSWGKVLSLWLQGCRSVYKMVQNAKLVTRVHHLQFNGDKCRCYLSKLCGMLMCFRSIIQIVYTVCWAYVTPMPSFSCPALWRRHHSCCWRHSTPPTISFIASPVKCNAKESCGRFKGYFINCNMEKIFIIVNIHFPDWMHLTAMINAKLFF
jgi:hypothetical protein